MNVFSKSAHRVFAVLAVALVTVACATSLSSLPPFPCAEDGTCPDGFGCGQGDQLCYACTNGVTSGQACNQACTDLQTDSAHCGTCGNACGTGSTCLFGQCQCASGTLCGEGASARCTDTTTDDSNCGSCGKTCESPATCIKGACGCTTGTYCSSGGSSTCANLDSDTSNCGECGKACAAGESCIGGRCGCPAGETLCGSTCVDLLTDASHCSSCDNACTTTEVCSDGMCGCAAGDTMCGAGCANLTNDANNCGMCAMACPTGMVCTNSACACATPPGGGQCDVFPQCGCTDMGPSYQCVRDNGGSEQCEPVGFAPTGSSCTSSEQCSLGDVCYGGLCSTLCGTGTPCAMTNYACIEAYYDDVDQGFAVCEPHCNPLNPFSPGPTDAVCPGGAACHPTGTSGESYCVEVTSQGETGALCSGQQDCAAQYDCVKYTGETNGSCELLCGVGSGTCSGGNQCYPFGTPLTIDGTMLGFCGSICNLEDPSEFVSGGTPCVGGATCAVAYTSGDAVAGTECEAVTMSGGPEASCSAPDECEAGYLCTFASSGSTMGTCYPWCTNIGSECGVFGGTSHTCVNLSPAITVNGTNYGVCNGT